MYYPKSQIKTDIYTNGGELIYKSTKEEYIGYYWKTSSGKLFSGKTPQDSPTQELISFLLDNSPKSLLTPNQNPILNSPNWTPNDFLITEYPKYNFKNYEVPTYSPNIPTENDYQIGEYRRLFCKKENEIIYLEIDKDTFNKLISKNSTIIYEYYQPFNMPWKLTGDKEQVYKTNKNIVELTMKQQKLPMFDKYIQEDYLKYYK